MLFAALLIGGSGGLDGVRMGRYKAYWTTGGADNCGGEKSKVRHHDPPLLFDLTNDPAEAHALDATGNTTLQVCRCFF